MPQPSPDGDRRSPAAAQDSHAPPLAMEEDLTVIVPVTGGPRLDETRQHASDLPPAAGQPPPRRAATLPGETSASGMTLPGGASPGPAVREVGRYRIGDKLGRGGMATVFKAHDPGIGRDVAIKFLHASLCEDEEYRARFLREARAAGGLSHPNIVTVHDVGEIERRPYMAMELLDGETLSDELDRGQPLAVRDVVVIGIQLARALDYAHARGIVHRDIKPGNIMRSQGTQQVKVLDFGIAHMESAGSEQRTRVGDILGTPQYMSPEQAQGDKLDGRSDLFSTGIVLYQMLTGQRPFVGDSLVALAMKIANEEPPPIEKLRPDVPAALRRVVERCLAKPVDRRFQSGKELSDALARVLAQLDEAAREKERQRIVPLRVKWAGTMALIVAVVMALTASVVTQRQVAAMKRQVTDYGAALARFIAAQNAAAALGEDWPVVEVAVQEIMKTGDFQSIDVIDRAGIVRASSTAARDGQAYAAPAAEALGQAGEGSGAVAVSRYAADGDTVLGFQAPITYQGKNVGRVALGIAEKPLTQVARLSMALMAVLVLVTVAAVAIAMYFVANWFAQPIKLVGESMAEIAKGRFDHRIREQRNDEFGLLYAAFDGMAQALQDRQTAGLGLGGPSTPTSIRAGSAEAEAGAAVADEAHVPTQPGDARVDTVAPAHTPPASAPSSTPATRPHGGAA